MNFNRKILLSILALLAANLACAQDCMGTTFSVKGYVIDQDHQPIPEAVVHAYGDPSFEKPGFDFTVTTDENGYFETESVFRYGCSTFQVEATVESFEPYEKEFYPPAGEGWMDELPEELDIVLVDVNAVKTSTPIITPNCQLPTTEP